ncbi:MAG: hypothetical protein ACYC5F_09680 [Thermoleophilia bacterium]
MTKSFRTIAEALISDYPERLAEIAIAFPSVKIPLRFTRRLEIVATPKEQAEPVSGELAAAFS